MSPDKIYLGDSVYARWDGYGGVWLTTENGLPTDPSNEIYVEWIVLEAMVDFMTRKMEEERSGHAGRAGGEVTA